MNWRKTYLPSSGYQDDYLINYRLQFPSKHLVVFLTMQIFLLYMYKLFSHAIFPQLQYFPEQIWDFILT